MEEDEHGVAWQLNQALHGTRRAALVFQEYAIQATVKIGFTVVRVAAQTFYHGTWLALATVHSDDFIAAGETQSLDMLDEALEQFVVLKKMPRPGPLEVGRISDGLFPKRTVSWSADGFHCEADNSRGEKVVRYGFLICEKRRTVAKTHEMQMNNFLMRSVTGTDRWYRPHTTGRWIAQIGSSPRQCSRAPLNSKKCKS